MKETLTLDGYGRRILSFLAGAGMMVSSIMTMRHFFLANYPTTIFEGVFCDISAFFNCDSSAYSPIAHFRGVPMGYFGLFAGAHHRGRVAIAGEQSCAPAFPHPRDRGAGR